MYLFRLSAEKPAVCVIDYSWCSDVIWPIDLSSFSGVFFKKKRDFKLIMDYELDTKYINLKL